MSMMIRLCSKSKDPQKALRIFNELQLDGFVEHSKPYNSIMMACASHPVYAPKTIEYWHLMHMKDIEPDQVTYVAVLKACAQLGDIQTAYDVLHELKLKQGIMNENIFNQLIRVYAGACRVQGVLDEHVDSYCADAWQLYEQMSQMPDVEINVQILNSLTYLHVQAVKPQEIEAKILPQYARHKIPYDENTYAHLSKLYLNLRDLDKVVELFDKSQEAGLKPIRNLCQCFLEAGLRKQDTELIIHALTKFIEIKQEPHHRVLKLLGNLRNIPDELYVLLKKNFTNYGLLKDNVRSFEQASFRPQADGMDKGLGVYDRTYGKRFNPKKTKKKQLPYSVRKNLVM